MHVIDRICLAIATEEGYFRAGMVPNRLNNPGDLIFAGQAGAKAHLIHGSDSKTRTFAEFDTAAHGIIALYRQVLKRVAEGATLRKLITDPVSGWAPDTDGNNASVYLRTVQAAAGVDPDVPLLQFVALEHDPTGIVTQTRQ